MRDTYTLRGQWWLPATPEARRSGTLTIDRGDAMLDVEGDFGHTVLQQTETETVFSPTAASQDRVVGVSTDGKYITLLDCVVSQGRITSPGIPTTIYRARVALIGVHFDAAEPIKFDQVDIRTSELETWIGASPFGVELGQPGTEDPWLTVRASLPEKVEVPLGNGLTAVIKGGITTSGLGGFSAEAKLTYTGWIGLRFPEPRDLEGVYDGIWQLRNFLSLAMGKALTLLAVDVYIDAVVSPGGSPMPIKLLYGVQNNPDPPSRTTLPQEMLFTFEEARGRFPEILGTWIDHNDLLGPVIALYFGTLYHPSLYVEQQFLGYAQAIETYDRLRRPEARERDADEHKTLVSEIVSAAPEGEQSWLKAKLAFSNEPILADRLRHVLRSCGNVSARVIGDDDVEAFVRAVKDSRNYYTHYSPALKAKAATGGRLFLLAFQLRAVIEAALLIELGFPCDEVENLLGRARRFSEIDNIRSQVE